MLTETNYLFEHLYDDMSTGKEPYKVISHNILSKYCKEYYEGPYFDEIFFERLMHTTIVECLYASKIRKSGECCAQINYY